MRVHALLTRSVTTSKKTIAIFGAGTGLGASLAHRFGREDYQVALVARSQGPLDALVGELKEAKIEAAAFSADLSKVADLPTLVRAIEEKLGAIDVAVYAPASVDLKFVPAVDVDAAMVEPIAQLLLFAPIEVAHAVLPSLVARGGAFVLGGGVSALHAFPGMSHMGPAIAGARNFVFTLNAELKDKGVYAGTVIIGASIERSGMRRAMEASGQPLQGFPVISPDTIAEEVWTLVTKRDRVEAVLPLPTK
jgi:short-subunit dehydrogenase